MGHDWELSTKTEDDVFCWDKFISNFEEGRSVSTRFITGVSIVGVWRGLGASFDKTSVAVWFRLESGAPRATYEICSWSCLKKDEFKGPRLTLLVLSVVFALNLWKFWESNKSFSSHFWLSIVLPRASPSLRVVSNKRLDSLLSIPFRESTATWFCFRSVTSDWSFSTCPSTLRRKCKEI